MIWFELIDIEGLLYSTPMIWYGSVGKFLFQPAADVKSTKSTHCECTQNLEK